MHLLLLPSFHSNFEYQISTTTHTRNVTPVFPSKRPRSQITDTSSISSTSTSHTSKPPMSEIYVTRSQSHKSTTHTPLIPIPIPETVERYVT